jgi:deazaflavin-dependent oxidoreductase (nitroreductase family)
LIVSEYYRPPSQIERVFNRIVSALMRLGIAAPAARQLEVRGRTSGQPRRTPVNLLRLDGEEYLVSPPGNTQWVRNIRAAGRARLLRGRRVREICVIEIDDAAKLPMLRAYLQRWGGALAGLSTACTGSPVTPSCCASPLTTPSSSWSAPDLMPRVRERSFTDQTVMSGEYRPAGAPPC